jgi:hypothetical protein
MLHSIECEMNQTKKSGQSLPTVLLIYTFIKGLNLEQNSDEAGNCTYCIIHGMRAEAMLPIEF